MSDLEKLAAVTIDRGYRIHHDLGPDCSNPFTKRCSPLN